MLIMAELTKAFAEAADGLESTAWEHRLGRSLNLFFNGRIRTPPLGTVWDKIDVDDYWGGTTGLVTPSNFRSMVIYSRGTFQYPLLNCRLVLPILAASLMYYFGLELGGECPSAYAALFVNGITAYFESGNNKDYIDLNITSLLPADYATVEYVYGVKVNKCSAELMIDGIVKAIVLAGVQETLPTTWKNNSLPYCLYSTNQLFPASLTTLVELDKEGATATLPIIMHNANKFVPSNGNPLPPRQYALYTENTATKWTGLTTAGTLITSHPIPVWGYTRKTLLFQADATGELKTQIYAGGDWRTVDTKTVVANTLYTYDLAIATPIARCTYNPANNDVIVVAEWDLE